MPGLDNLLLIVNELEKAHIKKRPGDIKIIQDVSASFKYAINKLKKEKEGNKNDNLHK